MKLLSAGLTALDLLVTLVIVTIIITLAVPGMQGYLLENRLRASTSELHSHLMYARSEAIQRRTATLICPGQESTGCSSTLDWHEGWIVFSDSNGDRDYQGNEPLLRVGQPPADVRITNSTARRRLQFLANGTAPGSNTTLRLCTPAEPSLGRRIAVSNSGRVVAARATDDDVTGC